MVEACDFETAIALTGFGRFNYRLLLAAFLSAVVIVWDTTTVAYIIPLARCDLELTSIERGALNAINYAGLICSSLLWGPMADTVGRIKLLKYAMFIDGCLAFISGLSPSLWMLLPMRFAVGFMAGSTLPVSTTAISEFLGVQYRSPCLMIFGAFKSFGQVLLPGLGLAILLATWELDLGAMYLHPWNVFMMVCALPNLLGALNFAFMPETPRFLMAEGRPDEALAVLSKMYAANTGNDPSTFPVERLVEEVPTARRSTLNDLDELVTRMLGGCTHFLTLFTAEYVRLTLLILFIMGLDLLSLNTVRLWLPQLFTTLEEFYDAMEASGNMTSVYMCDVLGGYQIDLDDLDVEPLRFLPLNVTAVSRSCEPAPRRKKIYIKSMILWGIVAVAVGFSSVLVKLVGFKRVIISSFLLGCIFCVSVLWATCWITTVALFTVYMAALSTATSSMMGEIASVFPTKLRATAVSISMLGGYLAGVFGTLLFPLLLELGCEMSFIIIACILLVAGLASFGLPLTKGHPLT